MAAPLLCAGAQFWVSTQIIAHLTAHRITDGQDYIKQSWLFLAPLTSRAREHLFLLYGLYPYFLSFFHMPALHWATAGDDPVVVRVYAAQAVLLAGTTAVLLTTITAFRTFAASLCLGALIIGPLVSVWPAALLMESTTIAALFLCVSATIASDAKVYKSELLVAASAFLVILARDPLIGFIVLFVALLAINELLTARRTRQLLLFGVISLVAIMRLIAIGHTDKYIQPLSNVIQLRILPDQNNRQFFVEHGMPISSEIMERADQPAQYKNTLFLSDEEVSPDFLAYRDWLKAGGFRTYAIFLVTHPSYLLRSFVTSPNYGPQNYSQDAFWSIADLFSVPRTSGYWTELSPLPKSLGTFLSAPLGWAIALLYFVFLCVGYVRDALNRRSHSALNTLALASFLAIVPTFHGDGLDEWRHCVPLLIVIYAGFVINVTAIADKFVREALKWRAAASPS